jgi:predicted thioesterase
MLATGIKGSKKVVVTESETARHLGSGDMAVFGTPAMIALMEMTAMESVQPYLADGQSTVGVHIAADHKAPTLVGMKVECSSELIEVDRKMLTFQIEVRDESGEVGIALHKRFIIERESYLEKAKSRSGKAA